MVSVGRTRAPDRGPRARRLHGAGTGLPGTRGLRSAPRYARDDAEHDARRPASHQRHPPPRPAGLRQLRGGDRDPRRSRPGQPSARSPPTPRGWPRLSASSGSATADRVGTFCWNDQAHLEAYMAVPSMGAVLHTLNIRLFPEQLAYVVNHAEDKVVIIDGSIAPLFARVRDSARRSST